ncbi:MAG: rod shape-determining protein RodA [Candidatus Omnitrophota bacterium]
MYNRLLRNIDKTLIIAVALILIIGLSSVFSATHSEGSSTSREGLFLRQIMWIAVGLILAFIIVHVDYQKFVDSAYIIFGLNILLLIVVLVYGHTRLGAQRWVVIAGVGFQPSEFVKISFILALSAYLGHRAKFSYQPPDLAVSFGLMFIPLVLIFLQPDLGTALMLIPIVFAMLFVRGASVKHLLALITIGLLSSPLLWMMMKGYQKQRLSVFINPNADPLGAGYTIIQSKIAIGSGFLFGKGWLSGTQNQLNFLPERHTDFIFSVIGEEGGLIGCALLIGLYCVLIYRGLRIAQTTGDTYGKLMATGIVTMLACQIIVNIGMASGFMPVVGLPLPLMSYGGSSLLTTLVSLGLLVNIGMRRPRF